MGGWVTSRWRVSIGLAECSSIRAEIPSDMGQDISGPTANRASGRCSTSSRIAMSRSSRTTDHGPIAPVGIRLQLPRRTGPAEARRDGSLGPPDPSLPFDRPVGFDVGDLPDAHATVEIPTPGRRLWPPDAAHLRRIRDSINARLSGNLDPIRANAEALARNQILTI